MVEAKKDNLYYLETSHQFRQEVIDGLSQAQKTLPCKYFYDHYGSLLFEEICKLDEYYITRTEIEILKSNMASITNHIGSYSGIIEFGSGAGVKTELLLRNLENPVYFIPVEISSSALNESVSTLRTYFPDLPIFPLCQDYTATINFPNDLDKSSRRVVFFPGSTLSNFTPSEGKKFLAGIAQTVGQGGGLLIGVDNIHDKTELESAYNDKRGVTAAFNKNLLGRINRELNGNFNLDYFEHKSHYNENEHRIEMHLISKRDQLCSIGDQNFSFDKGETIHTENSYKYSPPLFEELIAGTGFSIKASWTDPTNRFYVYYLHKS